MKTYGPKYATATALYFLITNFGQVLCPEVF